MKNLCEWLRVPNVNLALPTKINKALYIFFMHLTKAVVITAAPTKNNNKLQIQMAHWKNWNLRLRLRRCNTANGPMNSSIHTCVQN